MMVEMDDSADLGADAEPESIAERPKTPPKTTHAARTSKRKDAAPPARAADHETEAVFDDILASPGKPSAAPAKRAAVDPSADEALAVPAGASAASRESNTASAAGVDSRAQAADEPNAPAPHAKVGSAERATADDATSASVARSPRQTDATSARIAVRPQLEPLEPEPARASAAVRQPLPAPLPSRDSELEERNQRTAHVAVQPRDYNDRVRPLPSAKPTLAAADGPDLAEAAPSGSDLSRSPAPVGGGPLACAVPRDALRRGIDPAGVNLRVEVEADSTVGSIIVLNDPGDGLGQQARRCAFATRWQPGLDRTGTPARRTTVVSVRFARAD